MTVSETTRCAVCTRLYDGDRPGCPFCGAGERADAPPERPKVDPERLLKAMVAEADANRGPSRAAVWLAATGCASALLGFFLWPGPEGSFRMTAIAEGLAVALLAVAYLRR